MDDEIERIIAQSDVRAISDLMEKAVFIKTSTNIGYTRVANHFKIARSSLRRAVKAFQEGRELGQNGRPPIVQPEDEVELQKIVLQWKKQHGKDISQQELLEQVIGRRNHFINRLQGRNHCKKEKNEPGCHRRGDRPPRFHPKVS